MPHQSIQLIQASQSDGGEIRYLPYSIALLQAYVLRHARHPGRHVFLPYLYGRPPLELALSQCLGADICAFSVYVWNYEYSLALAQAIKARRPETLIVFGGPQVPDRAEAFLRQYPFIDLCAHGEGEQVFLALLESLADAESGRQSADPPPWQNLAGLSWLAGTEFETRPRPARLEDLDLIPSPYLLGLFDRILAQPGPAWVAMWESNRGCPFSCTFCDWGSATASKLRRFGMPRLQAEIDWFARHRIETVNCCDSNFGLLPRDLEISEAVITARARTGYPRTFFIQGAKNAAERVYTVQSRLIRSGLHNLATLSLQSLNPVALQAVKRENISLEAYRSLQSRFRADGVLSYTDLLIGLPGESYASFSAGIGRVIDEGQHHWISFYNVYLLPNAELAAPASRAAHALETVRIPYSETGQPLRQQPREAQEMLVATASYGRADWLRMRAYAWWVRTLYYQFKLLQVPLLTLRQAGGIEWRALFEVFSEGPDTGAESGDVLGELRAFFKARAAGMLRGEPEHCSLPKDPYWIECEGFVFTGLARPGVAEAFFQESARALSGFEASLPPGLLAEALALSEAIYFAQLRRQTFSMPGNYNLWSCYQAWLRGEPARPQAMPVRYLRDWLDEPLCEVREEKEVGSRSNIG